MIRRLFTAASAISLVLCIATASIWPISFGREINKSTRITSTTGIGIDAYSGGISLWLMHDGTGIGPRMHVTWATDASYAGGAVLALEWFHVGGNRWPTGQIRAISAPGWLWILATAILPATWFALVRRYRRALRLHGCHRCGYNLTGNTSGVCPECGTPITVKMNP